MGFSVSPTDYAILEQKIGKQAAADMARREGWQVVLPEGGFTPMSAMGGGNDVEDDEYYQDDEQTAALPPVGGLNAVDPYAADELAQEAISTQLRANMARIEKGMQRLRERRMGPTSSEKWLSIAAALGQPTKTGAFGESLGNLARSLAETKSAQREAEEKRDALLEKYGMDLSTEQLRLLMANASRTSQAARAAAAAERKRKGTAPRATVSQDARVRHSQYATEITPPPRADLYKLRSFLADPNVTDQQREEARANFDAAYGVGAAEIYGGEE